MNDRPKFTPGTWIVKDGTIFAVITLDAGPNQEEHWESVVHLPMYSPNYGGIDHEFIESQTNANAHLIAAAPEIYAELMKARQGYQNLIELGILPHAGWDEDARTYIADFDKALAKARGEHE